MFELYTEKACRVIFFARYELSEIGGPAIEPEHLLLALIREDRDLASRLLRAGATIESIREQVAAHSGTPDNIATSVDVPLSLDCKRVLAFVAEEAERLDLKQIGTEHLLRGLLRVENCFAVEILRKHGIDG